MARKRRRGPPPSVGRRSCRTIEIFSSGIRSAQAALPVLFFNDGRKLKVDGRREAKDAHHAVSQVTLNVLKLSLTHVCVEITYYLLSNLSLSSY